MIFDFSYTSDNQSSIGTHTIMHAAKHCCEKQLNGLSSCVLETEMFWEDFTQAIIPLCFVCDTHALDKEPVYTKPWEFKN